MGSNRLSLLDPDGISKYDLQITSSKATSSLNLNVKGKLTEAEFDQLLYILSVPKCISSVGFTDTSFDLDEVMRMSKIILENNSLARIYIFENALTMEGNGIMQAAVNENNQFRNLDRLPLLQYFPCTS
jgi:hypothetical protein